MTNAMLKREQEMGFMFLQLEQDINALEVQEQELEERVKQDDWCAILDLKRVQRQLEEKRHDFYGLYFK
ncbi:hypothetical protein CVD28_01260 [Bacillus sp. M6-12]|uniref:hypothetical protein n=1 Tax=Bacillus sp. M6-12 TaxID=2054166 RepID=UPI000C75719B|nr:hypothetical protein [Bacillus sp. M6-12]PLS19062.1 hypothetical protein CVD28_01260 [Bacillus sp. M6-12]